MTENNELISLIEADDSGELVEQIKKYIETTKSNIMQAVNSQMVLMY